MADIDNELQTVNRITNRFEPGETARIDKESARALVDDVGSDASSLETDQALSELYGMATLHPNAYVRYYMLDLVREHHSWNVFARECVAKLTHDDEDFVAFEALRTCADLDIHRSIDDLISISSWPSERLDEGKKPVGVGHAVVVTSLLDVWGIDDPEEVEAIEEYYRENGHVPHDRLTKPTPGPRDEDLPPEDAPEGMVYVPGGTYTIGVAEDRLPATRFDVSDVTEPYDIDLDPFYVDRYPVTNEEYDEFVEFVEAEGHTYCHPGEPDGKDHRRNTLDDDRVGPDHPATGIDYYDAYAYANWAGKDLPTEEEWEVAGRGESGDVFPWGDEWRPDNLNWAGRAFDREFDGLTEWRAAIAKAHRMEPNPPALTTPVDEFPDNESEFGVRDMVGNVWEYTKTNFFSRQEMYPVFGHSRRKAHEHLMENPEAFPVIRGGPWSAIPEMTTLPYRGKDLMTDRHNEIGFRCVRRTNG